MGAVLVWGNLSSQFGDAVSLSLLRGTEPGMCLSAGWPLTQEWQLEAQAAPLSKLQKNKTDPAGST